jgi:dipeptide transport system ATP-binding protein
MYAGQVMETGDVPAIFDAPRHPYTQALLDSIPERNEDRARLRTIGGVVPGIDDRPAGCLLVPRCDYAAPLCRRERPLLRRDAVRALKASIERAQASGTPGR